jgi:hypothetical protein
MSPALVVCECPHPASTAIAARYTANRRMVILPPLEMHNKNHSGFLSHWLTSMNMKYEDSEGRVATYDNVKS